MRPKVHLEQPEQPPKEATHRPAQGMLEEQLGGGEGGAMSCPPGELVEQGPGQAPPAPPTSLAPTLAQLPESPEFGGCPVMEVGYRARREPRGWQGQGLEPGDTVSIGNGQRRLDVSSRPLSPGHT